MEREDKGVRLGREYKTRGEGKRAKRGKKENKG